jgi:hypothetical protein
MSSFFVQEVGDSGGRSITPRPMSAMRIKATVMPKTSYTWQTTAIGTIHMALKKIKQNKRNGPTKAIFL